MGERVDGWGFAFICIIILYFVSVRYVDNSISLIHPSFILPPLVLYKVLKRFACSLLLSPLLSFLFLLDHNLLIDI